MEKYYIRDNLVVGEIIEYIDFRQYTSTEALGEYINRKLEIRGWQLEFSEDYSRSWRGELKSTLMMSYVTGDAIYLWISAGVDFQYAWADFDSSSGAMSQMLFVKVNGQIKIADWYMPVPYDEIHRGRYYPGEIDDPYFWLDSRGIHKKWRTEGKNASATEEPPADDVTTPAVEETDSEGQ